MHCIVAKSLGDLLNKKKKLTTKLFSEQTVESSERKNLMTDPGVLTNFSCGSAASADVMHFFSFLKGLHVFSGLKLVQNYVRDKMVMQPHIDDQ